MNKPSVPPDRRPPLWARRLLRGFCSPRLLEELEGDLEELFEQRVQRLGLRRARLRYLRDVLSLLRPFALKRSPEPYPKPPTSSMIRNYLTIARRNLVRHRSYAFINVLGLALGMSCGILIFTLVSYHLSFDNFHAHSDRIYRIVTEQHRETVSYVASVPSPLGKAFRNDYTFAEKVARIATEDEALITVQTGREVRKFKDGIAFAESEFFDLFNYPLLRGDKQTALTEPNTAILTESLARKYFGEADPMNQSFRVANKLDFRVTGILKDLPVNTDRKTEIYLSYPSLKQYNEWLGSDDAWGGISSSMQCFVRLRPGVTPARVEQVLPAYVRKYRPTNKNVHHYRLQPLADLHFNPRYGGAMARTNLWVLGLIGSFLIITACVNFVNLATAQALKRSKEVGIRKVLGSFRAQLFWQFIAETGLIAVMATILAFGSSWLLLPSVNDWFGSRMSVNPFSNPHLALFIPFLTALVTFFAGAYPGLILAGFQPVKALKGKLSQQHIGGFNTRRSLIVMQFTISQVLLIGMIVITDQMRYAKGSDLGFDKEAVVLVPIADEAKFERVKALKNHFSSLAGVEKVSLCQAAPASEDNWTTGPHYDNRAEEESFGLLVKSADDQYLPMFDLQLVAGRNLFPSDSVREFLVNEKFVRKLNLNSPRDVLGKRLSLNGDEMAGPIVGVVKDFHDHSFHEDINAVGITTGIRLYRNYALKLNLATAKTTLDAIGKAWSGMHPDQVFEYRFVDDEIAAFYATETLMLNLVRTFAAIAVFIGCLGLYGLVLFMVSQKTKEIGIRKVLGSSTAQVLWIFGRELSRLILIAFLVAAPLAYYAMSAWLANFTFKIELGAGVFIVAVAGSFLIAFLTVGYQSVKAARRNPVDSLRAE